MSDINISHVHLSLYKEYLHVSIFCPLYAKVLIGADSLLWFAQTSADYNRQDPLTPNET